MLPATRERHVSVPHRTLREGVASTGVGPCTEYHPPGRLDTGYPAQLIDLARLIGSGNGKPTDADRIQLEWASVFANLENSLRRNASLAEIP